IAEKALGRDTGARALRGVIEELMLELLYDLPDRAEAGTRYVIDRGAVENGAKLSDLKTARRESA
ncbi:MAG: ATP-dependent Clp protease ATP-binding subunit ClpX, partial [Phycisphaeraceae bacterium]|nr:ATP-dependent Clp protease ATP-binding subunit ClpX [Phycisphaeraceae bacterium]